MKLNNYRIIFKLILSHLAAPLEDHWGPLVGRDPPVGKPCFTPLHSMLGIVLAADRPCSGKPCVTMNFQVPWWKSDISQQELANQVQSMKMRLNVVFK